MKLRWRRPPRRQISLDPVQVAVVRFLLRFKAAPLARIEAEVANDWAVSSADFARAIGGLVEQEVVTQAFGAEDLKPFAAITPLGRRLRGRLPRETRSSVTVYL